VGVPVADDPAYAQNGVRSLKQIKPSYSTKLIFRWNDGIELRDPIISTSKAHVALFLTGAIQY
jgi:hypothetical protein